MALKLIHVLWPAETDVCICSSHLQASCAPAARVQVHTNALCVSSLLLCVLGLHSPQGFPHIFFLLHRGLLAEALFLGMYFPVTTVKSKMG